MYLCPGLSDINFLCLYFSLYSYCVSNSWHPGHWRALAEAISIFLCIRTIWCHLQCSLFFLVSASNSAVLYLLGTSSTQFLLILPDLLTSLLWEAHCLQYSVIPFIYISHYFQSICELFSVWIRTKFKISFLLVTFCSCSQYTPVFHWKGLVLAYCFSFLHNYLGGTWQLEFNYKE